VSAISTPTPTPRHTQLHEDPQWNPLWWKLALCLSGGSQHCHRKESPISISILRHRTTSYEHLSLKSHDDEQFHCVCRAELNIAMENSLQFGPATIQLVMPISTPILTKTLTHTRYLKHLELNNRLRSTLPLRLSSGSHHRPREASPNPTETDTPSHRHAHTRLLQHLPPYYTLWVLVSKR